MWACSTMPSSSALAIRFTRASLAFLRIARRRPHLDRSSARAGQRQATRERLPDRFPNRNIAFEQGLKCLDLRLSGLVAGDEIFLGA